MRLIAAAGSQAQWDNRPQQLQIPGNGVLAGREEEQLLYLQFAVIQPELHQFRGQIQAGREKEIEFGIFAAGCFRDQCGANGAANGILTLDQAVQLALSFRNFRRRRHGEANGREVV